MIGNQQTFTRMGIRPFMQENNLHFDKKAGPPPCLVKLFLYQYFLVITKRGWLHLKTTLDNLNTCLIHVLQLEAPETNYRLLIGFQDADDYKLITNALVPSKYLSKSC
jgi:hypothetical protein